EKKLSCPFPSIPCINGKATEECDRNEWIGRKLFPDIVRQILKIHAERGQSVITNNRLVIVVQGENKWSRHPTTQILTGLFLEIAVERFISARKARPIVRLRERFDNPERIKLTGHRRRDADVFYTAAQLSAAVRLVPVHLIEP